MQISPMVRSYVPFILFIDRNGVIRGEYTGNDPFFSDESALDKNIRAEIMKLLVENTKSAVKPVRPADKKKS